MANIIVLGSGAFGIALALVCNNAGHNVTIWSKFPEELDEIRNTGESSKLKGVKIPPAITLTSDKNDITGKDIVIVGIPSSFVRSVMQEVSPFISENTVIVNTSKGLENLTFKRMSEVISEECPNRAVVVLTGPSHAEELSIGVPTTVAVTSKSIESAPPETPATTVSPSTSIFNDLTVLSILIKVSDIVD